jgi:hypothetical protein
LPEGTKMMMPEPVRYRNVWHSLIIKNNLSPHGWQICSNNGTANIKKLKRIGVAPTLIGSPMTIGVSGKGKRFNTKWR